MNARSQEKIFPKSYAGQLFRIAEGDLASARILAGNREEGRQENIWFLVQQCIEKVLKAVLCRHGKPIPFVHDLGVLIAKLSVVIDVPFGYELTALNEFAAVRRYQEGQFGASDEETDDMITRAEEILRWGRRELRKRAATKRKARK